MQRSAGRVELAVRPVASRTRIARLHQAGCLKLRFPRPAGPEAEAILINTSGGLTGGDRLDQHFDLAPGSRLAVTTQACERVYRAASGKAEVTSRVRLADDASFAWLPQETILFDGGAVRRRLEVDAAATARFLLVESVILGREMMGESVRNGVFRDSWRIRIGGRLAFADELRLEGDVSGLAREAAVLGGNRAFATILAHAPDLDGRLAAVRDLVGGDGGASRIGGLLATRLAAPSGFLLRKRLVPVISALANGPLPLVWSL
ncbi:urease accessory protein UreD [Aurantimonas sp. VKM B-3413]|nr:urease accessory protein UreD [Aurantimonas sp. VKM B-3413]MCB8839133.1 urease accessory protein UreD [Aurantimonas sp. VKM B-3413]